MQQTTLFSINSRTNNSAHNKRNLDTNPNTEFSYNDILRDEVSKMSKQRKRSSVNNQLAQSSANARPVLNSAPQISLLPNYIANLSLGPTQNQVIKGDVNRDGVVDRNDVDALERHIVGLNDDVDIESSDMNGDGKISIIDVAKLELHVQETTKSQEKTQILKGDVNDDGFVDQKDVEDITSYRMGYNVKINMDKADIDGDGNITMADVSQVKQLVNGYDPQILKGDANGDGEVDYKDVDLMQRAQIKLDSKIDMQAADMDGDGEITGVDIAKTIKLANEYEAKFQKIVGDSNGDGIVNEQDINNIRNYLNDVTSSSHFVMKNSDVNNDGIINEQDIQGINNILTDRPIDWNESKRLLGDVNGDGEVSIADVQRVLNYTRGKIQLNEIYRDNADVNNDGVIDDRDVQGINNILTDRPIDWNEGKRLLGDADGDGEVSIADAQRVLNYARGKINLNELYRDNADVNNDGVVDEKDAEGIRNILQYGTVNNPNEQQNIPVITIVDNQPEEQQNIPIITIIDSPTDSNYDEPKYQELVTAARRAETYADSSLTRKVNSKEYIKEGGQFLILSETDNAYEVRYNTDEGLKDRWVSKDILIPKSSQSEQDITPAYQEQPQSFTSYSTNVNFDLDTYNDSSMGKKIGRVFKGETVTVLNETEDALQIRYGVGTYPNYTDFKIGWIPKNITIQDDSTKNTDQLIPVQNELDTNNSNEIVTVLIDDNNNPSDDVKPNMTEEVTDSARIFYVNPGYNQGDYYKEEGGLIITNLKVDKNPNVEKPITFDVYNTKDAMGIIEYYDENGKFIRADLVDPHDTVIKDLDSWLKKAKNTFDSIKNYGLFDGVPITHPSNSEHMTIEAPKGTHKIVVTNNQTESIYAYVSNLVEKFFAVKTIAQNFKSVIEADVAFDKDVEVNRMLEDVKEKFITSIIQTLQVNSARMALDNFSDEYNAAYVTGKYILQTIGEEGIKDWALEGFDLRKAFEDSVEYAISNLGTFAADEVKGIAWGTCKDLLKGNPAIFGIEALQATGNVLDYFSKLITEKQLENVKPMIFQLET